MQAPAEDTAALWPCQGAESAISVGNFRKNRVRFERREVTDVALICIHAREIGYDLTLLPVRRGRRRVRTALSSGRAGLD